MVENNLDKVLACVYVITPIIGLSINAIIQILSVRFILKTGLLRSIYFGFLAGFCSLLIIDILYLRFFHFLFQNMIFASIANMIIYIALGYCYFNFVGLSETARRIRMLIEIYTSKEGLSLEEILSRYNAGEIVKKRIDRLLNNGQLKYKDGKYFTGKPVVLLIACSVIFLKLLLLGRKSEFAREAL